MAPLAGSFANAQASNLGLRWAKLSRLGTEGVEVLDYKAELLTLKSLANASPLSPLIEAVFQSF